MKITFEAGTPVGRSTGKIDQSRQENLGTASSPRSNAAYQVDLFQGGNNIWERNTHGGQGKSGKGKTLEEMQQEMGQIDAGIQRDYKTVMSHTMSEEDYARMEEEGFQFENLDPETAVTIVDRIKVELARSGQDIAGYTDTVDMDTLAAIVGSKGLAQTIAESFAAADIPITDANVQKALHAWEMASGLETPNAGEYRYMIDNEMEPEIRNFYLAKSSGAASVVGQAPGYYADDVEGYYTKRADIGQWKDVEGQIDRILEQSGLEVTEDTRTAAAWLLERELPLTKENLARYRELTDISFPLTEEQVMGAAASAIAEGKDGAAGNLAEEETIFEKAAGMLKYYFGREETETENLAARRQLEEVRLRMTAEVNVKLLRSGFSIDTAPMEELIEALKQAEEEVALKYFPRDGEAVEKYRQYHTACDTAEDIPSLPAEVLGKWSLESRSGSLEQFHKEGKVLQDTYRKAESSYEALMTAPRADLGDNIRKAFVNVDDILADLGWECTEVNRKAARILGYNRMEMSTDNLTTVKEAYMQVERIVEQMTPAATLKMIRDGVNPLKLSLGELDAYFDGLPDEYMETAERYSKFLYGLEQQKEITQEERSSYIGIYRLLHQIEKSDGAVVGALVNSQAELNFRNLLSAVRSSNSRHMNVEVTDTFGTLSELTEKGVSISEQIAQGYGNSWRELLTKMSETAESMGEKRSQEAYRREQLKQIRHAAETEQECIAMLQRGELPVNAGNLLAAAGLQSTDGRGAFHGSPFRRWLDKMEKKSTEKASQENAVPADRVTEESTEEKIMTTLSEIENIWDSLDGETDFTSEYQQLLNHMGELIENSSLWSASASIDVKELQLIHKQLHVMGSLAKQEEYNIPMYIGEELTTVHLTIRRAATDVGISGERGRVNIALDIPVDNIAAENAQTFQGGYAHVEGSFRLSGGSLSGYFAGNTEEAVTKMQKAADIFHVNAAKEWGVTDLQIVRSIPREDNRAEGKRSVEEGHSMEGKQKHSSEELYRIARYFLQAVKSV